MEENFIEGEFKNEFANVDESLEAENININAKVVKNNKIYFDSGKGAIEINCDPKIKEISDKLNSLKIPNELPDTKSVEFQEMQNEINQIIFNMYSICRSEETAKYKDLLKNQLLKNDESSKKLVSLFLDKLESFSSKIFDCKVNIDCFNQTTYNLGDIFDFLEQNKNLIDSSVKTKCSLIKQLVMENKANSLKNCFCSNNSGDKVAEVLHDFFESHERLNLSIDGNYLFYLGNLFTNLVKFLNENPDVQNDCVKIIDEFIYKLYSRDRGNFVSMIKNIDCIENNGQITENALNYILVCQFDAEKYSSDNEYTTKKFDYIERKINTFEQTAKNIIMRRAANKCISDIKIFEDNLKQLWYDFNKLFHIKRSNYMNNKNADNLNEYNRIKNDRATLFNKFRKIEAVKQNLLKQKMIISHKHDFVPLTKCQKIFYTVVFIVTFPIRVPIFILVKTLRKLLHCILMGLEVIHKVKFKRNCKDCWAKQCEDGCFDGLEINGQQINERIQWYETKRWLFWRRILFPINFVLLIVIGVFLAIKKFFKSIIKVFITDYRIIKNIWADDLSTYMFVDKDIFQTKISEVICNAKGNISVLPIGKDKNMKIRNKFVDMSCPSVPYSYFSSSKFWDNFQCAIGLKNIKSADQWNKYAHEHYIPRLYCGSSYYYQSGIIVPKK